MNENIRNAFVKGNSKDLTLHLVEEYKKHKKKYRKALLLGNNIPEPISMSTTEEQIRLLLMTLGDVVIDMTLTSDEALEYAFETTQLSLVITSIFRSYQSNKDAFIKNSFLNRPLQEQLQTIAAFIQHQYLVLEKKKDDKTKYIGLSEDLSKYKVDGLEDIKVSEADGFENNLEMFDTLTRYIYYINRKSKMEFNPDLQKNVYPYSDRSIHKLFFLTSHKKTLEDLWENYKYLNWNSVYFKNEKVLLFEPSDKKSELVNRIALFRESHLLKYEFYLANKDNSIENSKSFSAIRKISERIDIEDVDTLFNIDKTLYEDACVFSKNCINIYKQRINEEYLNARKNGMAISSIIDCFEFLLTIALIYDESLKNSFDSKKNDSFYSLAPIVKLSDIISIYTTLTSASQNDAEISFKELVFSPGSNSDVFSSPLIRIDEEHILFTPIMISRVNLMRTIEMILSKWKYDFSKKGTTFENKLRFSLGLSSYIKVNTTKIEFSAFDGRDVEFDFLGVMNDQILLIEFKNVKNPYSGKERHNVRKRILEAVDQVNRREEVILNDWDKIVMHSDLKLNIQPPTKDKIVKIVCTNIFNFTSMVIDGVCITDDSTLQKFFLDPFEEINVDDSKDQVVSISPILKGSFPSSEEFMNYIKNPITTSIYEGCIIEKKIPIPLIEKDDAKLMYRAHYLEKDPYGLKQIELSQKLRLKSLKIKRNDKCPCGSGKKYKKCCISLFSRCKTT